MLHPRSRTDNETIFALEHSVHFLDEERTEAYMKYAEGVPQAKNVLSAKKSAGHTALLDDRLAGAEVVDAI